MPPFCGIRSSSSVAKNKKESTAVLSFFVTGMKEEVVLACLFCEPKESGKIVFFECTRLAVCIVCAFGCLQNDGKSAIGSDV